MVPAVVPARQPVSKDQRAFSCALLAIAGWSDAVGFLLFAKLYVSFMSGDATMTGVAAGSVQVATVGKMLAIQIIFVAGAGLGRHARLARPSTGRRVLLLANVCLLSLVTLCGALNSPALAFCLAVLAMGLQNAMMHEAAGVPVGTMLTGTLVRLGEAIVDRLHHREAPISENAGQWFAFVAAAAGGAASYRLCGPYAFAVPMIVTAMLIPVERRLPPPRTELFTRLV